MQNTAIRQTLMMSGGLDSVVLAHHLHASGVNTEAVLFRFAPEFSKNPVLCASAACDELGIPLHVVDLTGIRDFMLSRVPEAGWINGEDKADNEETNPVPTAMLFMPALALFLTQFMRNDAIAIGVIRNQAEKNPAFVEALQAIPRLTLAINPVVPAPEVVVPFAEMDKVAVIRRGVELGVNLANTWSCADPMRITHCGVCVSCTERRNSFLMAGVEDRTSYDA